MQRFRIPQSPLLLNTEDGAAEGARTRSINDGFIRPLRRPVMTRERAADRSVVVQPFSQTSPASVSSFPKSLPGPIARFFSRMVEQLVNDFASGTAATHPEAYLMWLEYREADRTAVQSDSCSANAETNHRGFNTQAERRVDMLAHLTQQQSISAATALQSLPDIEEATPIRQDEPARRHWLPAMMTSVAGKMRQAREMRRGMLALQSMDDRMLQDIGISRYEIEQVARYGRSRK